MVGRKIPEKALGAAQIAIEDQGVDLGFGELLVCACDILMNVDADMKAIEDALENADFLPITRDNHGLQRHAVIVDKVGKGR